MEMSSRKFWRLGSAVDETSARHPGKSAVDTVIPQHALFNTKQRRGHGYTSARCIRRFPTSKYCRGRGYTSAQYFDVFPQIELNLDDVWKTNYQI